MLEQNQHKAWYIFEVHECHSAEPIQRQVKEASKGKFSLSGLYYFISLLVFVFAIAVLVL